MSNFEQMIGAAKADNLFTEFLELKSKSPIMARFLADLIYQEVGIDVSKYSELASTSASTANKLGLAFNKNLKMLDKLIENNSPENEAELRKAYNQLLNDYEKLLDLKTPNPTVITEIVEVGNEKEKRRIEDLEKTIEVLRKKSLETINLLQERVKDLEYENETLSNLLRKKKEVDEMVKKTDKLTESLKKSEENGKLKPSDR